MQDRVKACHQNGILKNIFVFNFHDHDHLSTECNNVICNMCFVSVFSLCEYVVILSNLGYHATSYYDYYHVTINLSSLL